MKIGVISDTHVPSMIPRLPDALPAQLRGVSLILHAGDVGSGEVLQQLRTIARVEAVYGNSDRGVLKAELPRKRELVLEGRRVGLIHGNRKRAIEQTYLGPNHDYDSPELEVLYAYLASELPEAEVIVFGHVHVPVIKRWRERLLINPGAVAAPEGERSIVLLELSADAMDAEIVRF